LPLFSEDIADRVRAGDPDAIGTVYATLAERLLGYLMARVRDRQVAEDLLEATFIELIERGHTIRGGGDVIKAWLFRTAHFNTLDHVRRQGRAREDLRGDVEVLDLVDQGRSPEDLAVSSDTSRRVRRFMGMLSEDQQEVLLLRCFGGLTAPETAEILGKNLAAVKGLQHRGERSLARLMGDGSGLAASSRPPGTSQEKWGSA
jgi:RNA polymerase sigma-70 factor, ECF subfamily